jgi:UPF0716 protein FxsA
LQFLFLIFILVPIVEIMVFIQVGDVIGLGSTIVMVILTAIVGVNLLKQQGLKTWSNIQQKLAQGQAPALEMASAAQLLFAGGLLLTPGFVTDAIGFALVVPQIRNLVAKFAIKHWQNKAESLYSQNFEQNTQQGFTFEQQHKPSNSVQSNHSNHSTKTNVKPRSDTIIEGEYESYDADLTADNPQD